MASPETHSYHDDLDLESDLKGEVAQEGDLCQEFQLLEDVQCDKNPGHEDFVQIKDMKLELLPDEHRREETLQSIKKIGRRIVMLKVQKKKKIGIRETEVGSGYLIKRLQDYIIVTNNHVVKTQDDVENCTISFFYDTNERPETVTSRGLKLIKTCAERDITGFTFDPVPDKVKELELMDEVFVTPFVHITYGDENSIKDYVVLDFMRSGKFKANMNLNADDISSMFVEFPDGSISKLSSPLIKFQQDIKDLTDIEIHVSEENGGSRALSGEIIEQDGNFVVKISENLLQDEAKQCKLISNGSCIAQGGKLYFDAYDSKEFFKHETGVDYEMYIDMYKDKVWLFSLTPMPKELQFLLEQKSKSGKPEDMFVISHPHGSTKVITFGKYLGDSTEKFDAQGRRIKNPADDCAGVELKCLKYSCKTCPGSSGAPVCSLTDLSGYCTNIHFRGEKTHELHEGKLIENINIGWQND